MNQEALLTPNDDICLSLLYLLLLFLHSCCTPPPPSPRNAFRLIQTVPRKFLGGILLGFHVDRHRWLAEGHFSVDAMFILCDVIDVRQPLFLSGFIYSTCSDLTKLVSDVVKPSLRPYSDVFSSFFWRNSNYC